MLFPPGASLLISLNVEVCEKSNQGNHVPNLEVEPAKRKRAWPDDSTAGLDDRQHELDQLALSDVLLPPQVWAHGGHR